MEETKFSVAGTLSEAQTVQLHALYQGEWWSAGRTLRRSLPRQRRASGVCPGDHGPRFQGFCLRRDRPSRSPFRRPRLAAGGAYHGSPRPFAGAAYRTVLPAGTRRFLPAARLHRGTRGTVFSAPDQSLRRIRTGGPSPVNGRTGAGISCAARHWRQAARSPRPGYSDRDFVNPRIFSKRLPPWPYSMSYTTHAPPARSRISRSVHWWTWPRSL